MLLLLGAPLFSGASRAEAAAAPTVGTDRGATVDEQAMRDRVETYLSTIDTPISQAQWKALGPAAVPILEREAGAEGALPSRRARAVEGLAAIGDPGAEPLLIRLAADPATPFVVRAAALRGEGSLVPAGRLMASLRPFLEDCADPRVRGVAAEVLARHAPASGCKAVAAQAMRESARERELFSRALEICHEP
jgi:HEAT repeat protein